MLTTRHPVDCPPTRQKLDALFRDANAPEPEKGGRNDAREAAVNECSHQWQHPATGKVSHPLLGGAKQVAVKLLSN